MKNITFEKYRAIDLFILAAVLFLTESLAAKAAADWFPWELYTLSPTVALVTIVMMRWGAFAAIHAVAGGLAFCVMSGARPEQYAVYCIGNCLALSAMLLFKAFGKENIRQKTHLTVIFTCVSFCGAELGRGIVSLFFGAPADSVFAFFTADSLSLVFAVVVVLISRKADGLFEDQKAYLIRTEAERRKSQID